MASSADDPADDPADDLAAAAAAAAAAPGAFSWSLLQPLASGCRDEHMPQGIGLRDPSAAEASDSPRTLERGIRVLAFDKALGSFERRILKVDKRLRHLFVLPRNTLVNHSLRFLRGEPRSFSIRLPHVHDVLRGNDALAVCRTLGLEDRRLTLASTLVVVYSNARQDRGEAAEAEEAEAAEAEEAAVSMETCLVLVAEADLQLRDRLLACLREIPCADKEMSSAASVIQARWRARPLLGNLRETAEVSLHRAEVLDSLEILDSSHESISFHVHMDGGTTHFTADVPLDLSVMDCGNYAEQMAGHIRQGMLATDVALIALLLADALVLRHWACGSAPVPIRGRLKQYALEPETETVSALWGGGTQDPGLEAAGAQLAALFQAPASPPFKAHGGWACSTAPHAVALAVAQRLALEGRLVSLARPHSTARLGSLPTADHMAGFSETRREASTMARATKTLGNEASEAVASARAAAEFTKAVARPVAVKSEPPDAMTEWAGVAQRDPLLSAALEADRNLALQFPNVAVSRPCLPALQDAQVPDIPPKCKELVWPPKGGQDLQAPHLMGRTLSRASTVSIPKDCLPPARAPFRSVDQPLDVGTPGKLAAALAAELAERTCSQESTTPVLFPQRFSPPPSSELDDGNVGNVGTLAAVTASRPFTTTAAKRLPTLPTLPTLSEMPRGWCMSQATKLEVWEVDPGSPCFREEPGYLVSLQVQHVADPVDEVPHTYCSCLTQ